MSEFREEDLLVFLENQTKLFDALMRDLDLKSKQYNPYLDLYV